MPKYKSFSSGVRHLKQFGQPSDEDYALIKEFLPTEIKKDDIFVYSIKLCDNLLDRDEEFFTSKALEQLAEKFKGATGIFNHEWKSDNQHSRIYKTELVTDNENKNESEEPYQYIVGYAYTLNTDKNKKLIEDVSAGILKEVSIGFKHEDAVEVKLKNGQTANRIDDITDVYEWSFVAVPAQRNAGVVKSYSNKEVVPMKFTEALAKLKSFQGVDENVINVLSTAAVQLEQMDVLQATVKSLTKDIQVKDAKIKELEGDLVASTLEHAIKDVLDGFTLVNDTAGEIAKSVCEKGLSVGEDGEVSGVEETKELLANDYKFLFKQADGDEDDTLKGEDGEGEDTTLKGLNGTKKKSINFTAVSNVKTKSKDDVQAVQRGFSF